MRFDNNIPQGLLYTGQHMTWSSNLVEILMGPIVILMI